LGRERKLCLRVAIGEGSVRLDEALLLMHRLVREQYLEDMARGPLRADDYIYTAGPVAATAGLRPAKRKRRRGKRGRIKAANRRAP